MLALSAAILTGSSALLVAPLAPPVRVTPRGRLLRMEEEAEEDDFKGAEAWSEGFKEPEPVFDILKIKEVLPHRYPFLLVDKIIEFVPGKKAVGVKKVTTNEEL